MPTKKISAYADTSASLRVVAIVTDTNTVVTGKYTIDKGVASSAGAISPAVLGTTGRIHKLGLSAGSTIAGFTPAYGDGQEFTLYNTSGVSLKLLHNAVVAGPGMKLNLPLSNDFWLQANQSLQFRFDSANSYWTVIGGTAYYAPPGAVLTDTVAGSGTLARQFEKPVNVDYVTATSPITVNLAAGRYDGQLCWLVFINAVASISYGANMSAFAGMPALAASIAAGGSLRFVWSAANTKWYAY